MTRESILDRIKKLQALADGGADVNECALAAARAQELIEHHRIEEAELCELTLEEAHFSHEVLEEERGVTLRSWRVQLARTLARHNNCKSLVSRGKRKTRRRPAVKAKLKIVGAPDNIALVRYLFQAVARSIERLCRKSIREGEGAGKRWANSFRVGAVTTVKKRLEEARARAREDAPSTALVRVDAEMTRVAQWMYDNVSLGKTYRTSDSLDPGGFYAVVEAGKQLDLGGRKTRLGRPKPELRSRDSGSR